MAYSVAIVDDEVMCLTNARNNLSKENMRVSCLTSGQDLLKFIEKETPDLILLDIMMPGMDGFRVYDLLREKEEKAGKPHIPVFFYPVRKTVKRNRRDSDSALLISFVSRSTERS